jgi:hypothetical protein
MYDGPSITDWITAAATGATAAIAGYIAWLGLHRDSVARLPVVEAELSNDGGQCTLRLIVRNRLPEAIVVTSARIRRPKSALISRVSTSSYGEGEVEPPTSDRVDLNVEIAAAGTERVDNQGGPCEADVKPLTLYLFPPVGWVGGSAVIDLRISSRALTLRDKRIAIRRFMPAHAAMKTAARASSQA